VLFKSDKSVASAGVFNRLKAIIISGKDRKTSPIKRRVGAAIWWGVGGGGGGGWG